MKKFTLLAFFYCCIGSSFGQYGQPDPTFGTNGIVHTDMGAVYKNSSQAYQVLKRPDGSFYLLLQPPYTGLFVSKRFADGSIDSTYGIDGYSNIISSSAGYGALQTDDKVVLIASSGILTRLAPNGKPDSSFGTNGLINLAYTPRAVAIQANGKILVTGGIERGYVQLVRYNSDGSIDNTFSQSGSPVIGTATSLALQANGKILLSGTVEDPENGNFFLTARYNTDGSLDGGFGNGGTQTSQLGGVSFAYSVAVQPDQKVVVGGFVNNRGLGVVRYLPSGKPDSSFNGNGKQVIIANADNGDPTSMIMRPDGEIIIAGYTYTSIIADFVVGRINPDGKIDSSFGTNGRVITDIMSSNDVAVAIADMGSGKSLVAGYAYINGVSKAALVQYNNNGGIDSSFGNSGKLLISDDQGSTYFASAAIQTDGKIVAAGITWNGATNDFAVARYNTDGSLDKSFSGDGKQMTEFGGNDIATAVVIQLDGKIVVSGNNGNQFGLVRYNTNGTRIVHSMVPDWQLRESALPMVISPSPCNLMAKSLR